MMDTTQQGMLVVDVNELLVSAPGLLDRGTMLGVPDESLFTYLASLADILIALPPHAQPDVYTRDAMGDAIGYLEDDCKRFVTHQTAEMEWQHLSEDMIQAAVALRAHFPEFTRQAQYLHRVGHNRLVLLLRVGG